MVENTNVLDLTDFDFKEAVLYKSRTDRIFYVEELKEDLTIVRSWGVQELKKGDFLVYKPKPNGLRKSGVRREAFLKTYEAASDFGYYFKNTYIRAIRIEVPFCFKGVDSAKLENAPAGSYLTLNLTKDQEVILIDGRRDLFFLKESDLVENYEIV